MTPRLFCLILGFAIGAALIGLIWIVWYVIHKEPDRLEQGKRTNRPEHWTQIKTFVPEDAIRTGKVVPKVARYGNDQDMADWMKPTETDKALLKWRDKYMRNADPNEVEEANRWKWHNAAADEMMQDELEKILERWNDGKDN